MTSGSPTSPDAHRRATVPPALAGERLDRACAALFADMSRGAARRAIERGGVTVDGRRVRACSRPVRPDSVVAVAPEPAPAPATGPLDVVYHDDDLIVVVKPPGQLTQPSPLGAAGTLLDDVERHLRRGRRRPYVGLVHRLDRDASGLIVFGLTRAATAALSEAVRGRTAERRYDALVRGAPADRSGRIDLPLAHDARTNRAAVDHGRGRPAATRWELVARSGTVDNPVTHVAAWLETGRTHQLRVHFAATLGAIVGDRRYGTAEGGEARLYLHASRLVVPHPTRGEPLAFDTPPPAAFTERLGRQDGRGGD